MRWCGCCIKAKGSNLFLPNRLSPNFYCIAWNVIVPSSMLLCLFVCVCAFVSTKNWLGDAMMLVLSTENNPRSPFFHSHTHQMYHCKCLTKIDTATITRAMWLHHIILNFTTDFFLCMLFSVSFLLFFSFYSVVYSSRDCALSFTSNVLIYGGSLFTHQSFYLAFETSSSSLFVFHMTKVKTI